MNRKPTPLSWPQPARTRDGVDYRIRPIEPADAARERAFILAMSAVSRYQRFMFGMSEPSPEFVQKLVTVDHHHNMALVAVIGGGDEERIIGVARYAVDETGKDCEFAVAVADDWQGRGIATAVARLLFEYAAQQGFRTIYGLVQPNNERMLDLARHLGLEVENSSPRQESVRAILRLN